MLSVEKLLASIVYYKFNEDRSSMFSYHLPRLREPTQTAPLMVSTSVAGPWIDSNSLAR